MPTKTAAPTDSLFRARESGGIGLRAASDGQGDGRTMFGHAVVFNTWTEIDSWFEGRFLERFAPGSFKKTIRENRDTIRCLFQHGRDPSIGDKPLGPFSDLREDGDIGVFYEVPLLRTDYVEEILPGLEAGLYGASFRFRVVKEDWVNEPKRTKHNPDGLPERTVTEGRMFELGPVTFPQYPEASSGVRSITDLILDQQRDARTERPRVTVRTDPGAAAPGTPDPAGSEPPTGPSDVPPEPSTHSGDPEPPAGHSDPIVPAVGEGESKETEMPQAREDLLAAHAEAEARLQELAAEIGTERATAGQQEEWDRMVAQRSDASERVAQYDERMAVIKATAGTPDPKGVRTGAGASFGTTTRTAVKPENIYDLSTVPMGDPDTTRREYRDRALRAIESGAYPFDGRKEDYQTRASFLLEHVDNKESVLARRMLVTGSPVYMRAFGKWLASGGNAALSPEEQRTLALGSQGGSFPVPFTLDPTVILTSDGSVNPIRAISRVETIVTTKWQGVASTGIVAAYGAESTEAGDNSPTLTQPEVDVEKAKAFIPFSIEVGEDWSGLQTEITRMLQDAKDDLEADKFINGAGSGSDEPEGIVAGLASSSHVDTAAQLTFALEDLYALEEALPPRFRSRARFVANRAIFNKVRQFDTAGGAALWVRLADGLPPELVGYPAHEASEMDSAVTADAQILLFGDFRHYVIVDRVGMNVELIPHLFATANNRPSGQRGIWAHWRNSALILADNAFRLLVEASGT